MAVVVVQMAQLSPQHGSMYLVKAAVAPLEVENVFLLRAIVAQCPHHVGQLRVVGGDGTAVAYCPEVRAGVEAVACGMTQ